MEKKTIFSRILPYLVALVTFMAVDALYFAPQFSGKSLPMHDVTQYWGMSQDIREHKAEYGEDPQWEGNMFSGMPSYLINFEYKTGVLKTVDRGLRFLGEPSAFLFVAMAGFFFMLIMCRVNPWVAIVPALAYGLSTYTVLIIGAGHIAKVLAIAYAPPMIGAVMYAYRRNMWLGAALTALFAAIEIMVNHPQITYYFVMVLVAFFINEFIVCYKNGTLTRFAKATGLLAIAAVLALSANFSSLYYVAQHTGETTRGGSELTPLRGEAQGGKGLDIGYATAWSYGVGESFNMFIPDFKGGASDTGFSDDGPVAGSLVKYGQRGMARYLPPYWGTQPMTAGPTYLGAVVVFLALLGLFLLRSRNKWWIVAISALAVTLSWGHNFMPLTELFFNYFPGYNKFRAVATILVIVQWSAPFVAALALNKIWQGEVERPRLNKSLKYSLRIAGALALIFALFGGVLFDFSAATDADLPGDVVAAMQDERASMLRSDSIRSLVFVLLSGGMVWLFASGRLKRWGLVASLAALVVFDLAWVDMRYLPQNKFVAKTENKIKPSAANLQILEDKTPGYRVANFAVSTFNDATTSYFHRSIGGYHGAKLQRYQDIIDRQLSRGNEQAFNMLNTKYFIFSDRQSQQLTVQQNHGANGAVWFVDNVVLADGADREMELLGTLDTRRHAVVDTRFAPMLESVKHLIADSVPGAGEIGDAPMAASGSFPRIELTDYKINHLTYRYDSDRPAVAVFSEVYYDKGWSAYIDGVEAPYFRADYILRAMVLTAGEHTVEFRFEAPNFKAVTTVTIVSSALILLLVATAGYFSVRQCKNNRQNGSGQPQA